MDLNKTLAFTLAEVTLAVFILGVIAAETIPGLLSSYQKKVWETAFKTNYKMISEATVSIMADNAGTMQGSWSGNSNYLRDLYATKLKMIQTCDRNGVQGVCWHLDDNFYALDGDVWPNSASAHSKGILANGTMITFEWIYQECDGPLAKINGVNSQCAIIFIDTNGFNGPNTYGKDIFELDLTKNGLYPRGSNVSYNGSDNHPDYWAKYCDKTSSYGYVGSGCAGRLMIEGIDSYLD